MAKLTLNNINSRYASVAALNDNFDKIETALENTLSRDGTVPNNMSANLDMNNRFIINVPDPVNNKDAANKEYVDGLIEVASATSYVAAAYHIDEFEGDGTDTVFTLALNPGGRANTQVYIDGVYQVKSTYSVAGANVTFSEAPHEGAAIEVVSVTPAESTPEAFNYGTVVATAGQTIVTVQDYSTVSSPLQIFLNGILLIAGEDYTETTATTITMAKPLAANDVIRYFIWGGVVQGYADASTVNYSPAGTGAVDTSVQAKLRESVSVKDFGAVGDGVTDDTAAIQAAIDYTKTFSATQNEVGLLWPAGNYNVTTLDFVGANRVTNYSDGNVNIYGTSVGGTSIIDVDGTTVTPTTRLNWIGNFSVQIGSGGSYSYGVYISYMTNSRWNMSVSGAYSVNTVYIDYSWDNPELYIAASNSSGTAIATVKCGSNNVNRNSFWLRTTGSSDMGVASIGFQLAGNANVVHGDFSSSQIGIRLNACRSCMIISPYFELNKYNIQGSGNPISNTIIGGLFEVGSSGYAFDLNSSQQTTVIGSYIKGVSGGSSRTAFNLGTGCYGLTVQQAYIDDSTIDTTYAGTWHGTGNFTKEFNTLAARWIGFPQTNVVTTDANTLDDYEEGSWTPTKTVGTAFASASGKYTKIGNQVTATFLITFAAETNANAATMSGFPFSASGSFSELNGLGVGYNTSSTNIGGSLAATTMTFRKVGAGGGSATITNMSGATVTGTMTYFTTA